MVFFGKKEKEVEELIVRHIQLVKQTLTEFSALVGDYLNRDKQFKEDAYRIHTLEHEADSTRRQVSRKLCQGAFLPIFREDYVVLLELIDKIANKAEATSDLIVLTRPRIPDFLIEGLRELTEATVRCFDPIENLYDLFQKKLSEVLATAAKVEEGEQAVDMLQWNLIKAVFKSDLSLAEKLLLKELIDDIATISDRIEDVSDRFEIMVVKRSI
jgi:uncharacterized protein